VRSPQGGLWCMVDADTHPDGLMDDIRKFAFELMAEDPELQVSFFFFF
jgi:hypothetical protein